MRITSIASGRPSGGRIEGRRWASIVLPVPGGPLNRLLWPPAAATVRASTASCCPRTSSRSSPRCRLSVAQALPDRGNGSGAPPRRIRTALLRRSTTPILRSSTSAASCARFGPRRSILMPALRHASATARVPWHGRTSPSSESSPNSACVSSSSLGICPLAARTAQASARSNPGPIFGMSAGAKFAVIRLAGNSKPEFNTAARTRSRASRTAASARPTIVNAGSPALMSTSTLTARAWSPSIVNVRARASTRASCVGFQTRHTKLGRAWDGILREPLIAGAAWGWKSRRRCAPRARGAPFRVDYNPAGWRTT